MSIITTSFHLSSFAKAAASSVQPGALVLDAGAGESPYRDLFAHTIYEGADICVRDARRYPHIKYQCDLSEIPVEDQRFDLVLCTQVLEHVPNPQAVLAELFRVLKSGGRLWISAPFAFEEHEVPYDYFRFTRYAWERMLTEAGFSIERIEWLQGYMGTLAYQLNLARHFLPRRAGDYGGGAIGLSAAIMSNCLRPFFGLLAWLYSRLDLRYKYTEKGHCIDYCVVASKGGIGTTIASTRSL